MKALTVCSILFLAALMSPALVPAQPPDTSGKPRDQKKEADKVYDDWISKDVPYIATKAEKEAFNKLKTREEKENFIAVFWDLRDPDPDTEVNEYREEYYERIAYANEHFTSGVPGWMTDRGRIYITWGKPDSVESRPMGGSYDRPAWEGGGTTSTYPFEIWFYRSRDGLRSGVEFEFVDRSGTGEYRLSINPNEKDALLFVPGAGPTTGELLGIERRSDRIAGIGNRNYLREQDSPFVKLENISMAFSPPPVRGSALTGTLEDTPVIDNNPLDFDMRVDLFRQGEDSVIATFTILTNNSELSFSDLGGVRTAHVNVLGRIDSVTGRKTGTFEDSITASENSGDPSSAGVRRSIYQSSKSLAPGRYKVTVNLRDVVTGSRGTRELGFEVPDYSGGALSTSTLVLASTLRPSDPNETGARFVIGGTKVIPNLTGEFRRGQDVGVYLQVYNAAIDQTTLKPSVEVSYVLSKDGIEIERRSEDWSGLSESSGRITLAKLFPTAHLDPGNYKVVIVISDRVGDSGRLLAPSAEFILLP
ncbi:MAG: GWxTD domain-containing protein [Aridibacter famidurans]|nr:GWxTD domain-containing protein [Aridibacter famidurans]